MFAICQTEGFQRSGPGPASRKTHIASDVQFWGGSLAGGPFQLFYRPCRISGLNYSLNSVFYDTVDSVFTKTPAWSGGSHIYTVDLRRAATDVVLLISVTVSLKKFYSVSSTIKQLDSRVFFLWVTPKPLAITDPYVTAYLASTPGGLGNVPLVSGAFRLMTDGAVRALIPQTTHTYRLSVVGERGRSTARPVLIQSVDSEALHMGETSLVFEAAKPSDNPLTDAKFLLQPDDIFKSNKDNQGVVVRQTTERKRKLLLRRK